jgi:hypothetical protein
MVNLKGQVVGINSAIASTTGVYQGYGFAIPINLARRVMQDLVEYGHVRRPRIGVAIGEVAPEDAEVYGLPSVSGVLVQTVEADGPARGVLQPEDVIVAIEGEPVGYVAELQAKIAEHRPGDRVRVTVYRGQRRQDVTIRLAEAPINGAPTVTAARTVHSEERLGINVEDLDASLAQQIGYDPAGGRGAEPGRAGERGSAPRRGAVPRDEARAHQRDDGRVDGRRADRARQGDERPDRLAALPGPRGRHEGGQRQDALTEGALDWIHRGGVGRMWPPRPLGRFGPLCAAESDPED